MERNCYNAMKTHSPPPAFSLIELLIVMAVIVILMAFAVPAFNTISRGTDISRAESVISGTLAQARQTAMARNRKVEVRFYSYKNANSVQDASQYRAMQLFDVLDDGTFKARGKVMTLPERVMISSSTPLSSLMEIENDSNHQVAAADLPTRLGSGTAGFAFRMLPNGSTDLPDPSKQRGYFLTLFNENDLAQASGSTPPPNYATIQIDPFNGRTRLYRP